MSWLFSRALVEEYSPATCLDGEPYAQLNVMPTPHKFWRNDRTIEPSDLSQFGLTSRLLTDAHGEELLTSYRAASHARTYRRRAPGWASLESAAAYGRNSSALWATFDRDSSSLKTAQYSLFGDSIGCSLILPQSGLMLDGRIYQQPSLAPAMNVTAPGSLPTPLKSWSRHGPGLSNNLENLRMSLGVTQESLAIIEAVGWRWPASFTEWMMGWPIKWSALQSLEMGRFQSWRQLHSTCSLADAEQPTA
jgi:hypothetical protein